MGADSIRQVRSDALARAGQRPLTCADEPEQAACTQVRPADKEEVRGSSPLRPTVQSSFSVGASGRGAKQGASRFSYCMWRGRLPRALGYWMPKNRCFSTVSTHRPRLSPRRCHRQPSLAQWRRPGARVFPTRFQQCWPSSHAFQQCWPSSAESRHRSVNCPDSCRAAGGERLRTGVNETGTETRPRRAVWHAGWLPGGGR